MSDIEDHTYISIILETVNIIEFNKLMTKLSFYKYLQQQRSYPEMHRMQIHKFYNTHMLYKMVSIVKENSYLYQKIL